MRYPWCYLPSAPPRCFSDNGTPLDPSDDKFAPTPLSNLTFQNAASVVAEGLFGGQAFDGPDAGSTTTTCNLCPDASTP
jgi:hypothetical protein